MSRRSVLAATTAIAIALSTALVASSASADPPGGPAPADHGIDPALSRVTLAEARKAAGLVGLEGPVTALVELDATAGVEVAAKGAAAVREAAEEIEAVARSVVPAELTARSARSARSTVPQRVGTLTNLVAGTLVTGDADEVRALASSDAVTSIRLVVDKRPTNSSTVAFTRALQTWQDTGQTGEGVSIGVIDTGLDYTHADFGGPGTPEVYDEAYGEDGTGPIPAGSFDPAKFAGGYDFAGPLYDASGDEPGSTLIPTPDENPIDALSTSPNSGHGTHVAGTAAGYGVDASGTTFDGDYSTLTDLAGWKVGPGAAPGAQVWSFKVFGDLGGSTSLTALALDRAADPNGDGDLSDHVDVLNLSLGSDGTPADDPDNTLVDLLTKLGVVVAISSGNAGDITDIGGSPGNSASAITVANSVGAPVLDAAKVTAASDDTLVGALLAGQNSVAYDGEGVTAPVAYVSGTFDGCTAFTAAQAAAVAGKIAYLWWDDDDTSRQCGSAARFDNAAAAGAVGVVLPTGLAVFSAGIAGNDAIPGIQLTAQSTDALLPEIQAGTLTLSIGPGFARSSNLAGVGDLLDDGSSRGVHGSLGIAKPDVAAPGTGILSAASGGATTGHVLSGTSMAAPHVAGIAALVLAAHPAWSPTDVKAAVVTTATHDVTTEPDGEGLAYGPERVGAGRVDALQAVQTEVVAYSTANPALTSVVFGVVDVGTTTVTRTAKVTVRNTGSTQVGYAASFVAASTAGGATVSVYPTRFSVPAGATKTVVVTLTADPATLEREPDPTSSTTQAGLPREYVAMLTGRIVLDSRTDTPDLRIPVQAAPRLVSDLQITGDVVFGPTETTSGLGLTGEGVSSGGWQSLTTPLVLGITSEPLEPEASVGTSPSAIASGDVLYVGWSSTAPHVEALGLDPQEHGLLTIGVATAGDWASLGQAVLPVIHIDIDQDGEPDLESYVWKLDPSIDLTVVSTYDLHAPVTAPAIDVQPINGELGDVDTGVFDSNVFVAPISLGAVGIEPGDTPDVRVRTFSPYGADGVIDEEVSPFTVDPYDPTFWFENDRPSLVSTNGAGGVTIPVHRRPDAGKGWLLVLQHHNGAGSRVQRAYMGVPQPTTTTLTVTGGTTYGDEAHLRAEVEPSSPGTFVFREGTRVIPIEDEFSPNLRHVRLPMGRHTFTATWTPDFPALYLPSTSAPVTVTVGRSRTTMDIDLFRVGGDPNAVSVRIRVTGVGLPPSGKVALIEGKKVIGTGRLKVRGLTGTATIRLRDLSPGEHSWLAVYPGSRTTLGSKKYVGYQNGS